MKSLLNLTMVLTSKITELKLFFIRFESTGALELH